METNGANKALALNDGETVGTVSWQSAATIYKYNVPNYFFEDGETKSLGLRFNANYYGYFEIKVVAPSTLMLYNFGYQSINGTTIEAGEGSATTAIQNPLPVDVKVLIGNGKLTLAASGAKIERLQLLDMSGRTLRENMPQDLSLNITGLPAQPYLLAIYHAEAMRPKVRKVVLP